MITRLLIARHGNTFGPGDVVTRVGTTDLPLVESGLIQGRKLGVYLKQQGLIPDAIFTSELQRTIQTAQQIIEAIGIDCPIQPLSIFNEIDYGVDENQPEEKVVARLGFEALEAWEKRAIVPMGWHADPREIIKNWQLFSKQLMSEFPEKTILVVTSNGIARFAPYLSDGFGKKQFAKVSTGALCIFDRVSEASTWQCREWNLRPE